MTVHHSGALVEIGHRGDSSSSTLVKITSIKSTLVKIGQREDSSSSTLVEIGQKGVST